MTGTTRHLPDDVASSLSLITRNFAISDSVNKVLHVLEKENKREKITEENLSAWLEKIAKPKVEQLIITSNKEEDFWLEFNRLPVEQKESYEFIGTRTFLGERSLMTAKERETCRKSSKRNKNLFSHLRYELKKIYFTKPIKFVSLLI